MARDPQAEATEAPPERGAPRRRWLAAAIVTLIAAAGGWFLWAQSQNDRLPDGIASSNGRTEAQRIDIATKFAGRLDRIMVEEGDFVAAGTIVARMASEQIEAQLREAQAQVLQARQALIEANALLDQRRAELIFAEQELARSATLLERGVATGESVDLRRSEQRTAVARVAAAEAAIGSADAAIGAAVAAAGRLRADIAEYALIAPTDGRVQYRLAEPGEVLAAGARVLTVLDLTRVHMTVYLPTDVAGRLRFGAEARLIFDAAPQYVVPGRIAFVAAEAQFTPRYVETQSEREKLTFRVQIDIPPEILKNYQDVIKTGVPGAAYVLADPDAAWPDSLAIALPEGGS